MESFKFVYGDYEGADGEVRSGKWYGRWDKLEEGFSKNVFGAEYSGEFNPNGEYENGFIENPNGDLFVAIFSESIPREGFWKKQMAQSM